MKFSNGFCNGYSISQLGEVHGNGWVHLSFANIFVGAKHSGSKSLLLTHKLSAGMLRPYKIEVHGNG
jgi:hypothetical protein